MSSTVLKFEVLFYLYLLFLGKNTINGGGSFKTTQTGPKPKWNETQTDKLKKDLLMNYDKFVRPEHYQNTTEIKLELIVLHLETDEQKSTISVESWLKMLWTDSKLKWNRSDYGEVSVIRAADHEVWQPDIYLYNSASGGEQISRLGNRNVLIFSNGLVLWVPAVKLTAFCKFNLRYWPFDTQQCFLKFGSWVHHSLEIKLELNNKEKSIQFEQYSSASSWLMNGTAGIVPMQYACCAETYESAFFNFTITRKSSPYCALIVAPAVVTTFLILIQFWLPPQGGERITLNGFTAVILNVFLLYFSHHVFSAGSETPLIILFYSSSLYIVCFTMAGAIISYLLCNIQKTQPLPWVIKRILRGNFGKWILLEQYSTEIFTPVRKDCIEELKDHSLAEFDNKLGEDQQSSEDLAQQEWIIFTVAIDRILFLVYGLVFIILACTFLH